MASDLINHTPPAHAVEVQEYRAMKLAPGGGATIPGQSRILVDGDRAFVSVGKYWTVIDAADVPLVVGKTWSPAKMGKGRLIYVSRFLPNTTKLISLHRMLMDFPDGMVVDHVDCDPLNNTRANLRVCTQAQNAYNKRMVSNKCGFKGVYRKGKKWAACIGLNKKTKHLGIFDSPEEAHAAYVKAAGELFGEFARAA